MVLLRRVNHPKCTDESTKHYSNTNELSPISNLFSKWWLSVYSVKNILTCNSHLEEIPDRILKSHNPEIVDKRLAKAIDSAENLTLDLNPKRLWHNLGPGNAQEPYYPGC